MDEYIEKFKKALKEAKTEKEKEIILNRLYQDGFIDGSNEGQ